LAHRRFRDLLTRGRYELGASAEGAGINWSLAGETSGGAGGVAGVSGATLTDDFGGGVGWGPCVSERAALRTGGGWFQSVTSAGDSTGCEIGEAGTNGTISPTDPVEEFGLDGGPPPLFSGCTWKTAPQDRLGHWIVWPDNSGFSWYRLRQWGQ